LKKRSLLGRAVFLATAALVVALPATAAVPASGTVSPTSPAVTWTGGPFLVSNPSGVCLTSLDPGCDSFALTIEPPATGTYTVDVAVAADAQGGDYDLYVYGPDGRRVASSATESGNEKVTLTNPAAGRYRVGVVAWLVPLGGTYSGSATLNAAATVTPSRDSVLWNYDASAPQAKVEVPLRVVMVGFKPGEFDAAKILGEVPSFQRPGVLIPRGTSPAPDQAATPYLVPYEYQWRPQLVYASDAFADGLFAAMRQSSTTGDYSNPATRAFLERYNAARGVYRGTGKQVPANAPMRFVNGEAVEDWIAANSSSYLGFDFAARGKGPGRNPGYTVFVLNTWDAPQAVEQLQPEHEYHVFKINRVDPDTKDFDGIDWARVWGGRYRFMMVDLGAAPNPYEAETWGNRNRTAAWGSANYDPPLWEYRATAPRPVTLVNHSEGWEQALTPGANWDHDQLQFMLGRTVNQAVSFRFLHSYLYEPWPGTGQFYLSDNVWHDKFADVPWPSDLTKLYDQGTVIRGLSTLTPYFTFTGDVKFQYLSDAGGGGDFAADQGMLQQAKADGDDIAGTPFTAMHTPTAMDYFDATPRLARRGAPCYTSVPGLSVVVEKHYAWALPLIVAGIAPNRDGVPFGYLNSVSDVTKSSHADRDPALEAVHPQAFSGAFTYTAVHEASHYLGLAHPHDSIGATRNSDGSPRYYDGFTWAFNSTAAPTTYSHTELVYSILDQESIARGHAAYYLKWTDEALADGGQAYYDAGKTTVGGLPADAARLRKEAIDAAAKAEKLFTRFDFVNATFAAQRAWRAAAAYRDLARGLTPGTSELQKGTKLEGAASCPSATTR
jgi:hypothetical protein